MRTKIFALYIYVVYAALSHTAMCQVVVGGGQTIKGDQFAGVSVSNWMVDFCCEINPGAPFAPPPDVEDIFHSYGPDLIYSEVEFTVPVFSLPNGYKTCPVPTQYIVGIWGGIGGADSGTATYSYNGANVPIKGTVQNQPILWQGGVTLNIDCVSQFPKPIKSIEAWEEDVPQQSSYVPINAGKISEGDVIDVQITFGTPTSCQLNCSMQYRVYDETTGTAPATGLIANAYTTQAACLAQAPNGQCFGWGTAEAFVEGLQVGDLEHPAPHFDPINGQNFTTKIFIKNVTQFLS